MSSFKVKADEFINCINGLSKNNTKNSPTPKWIKPFLADLQTFASDLSDHLSESGKKFNEVENKLNIIGVKYNELQGKYNELEGRLAVQKAVTDSLFIDRYDLEVNVKYQEDELDYVNSICGVLAFYFTGSRRNLTRI